MLPPLNCSFGDFEDELIHLSLKLWALLFINHSKQMKSSCLPERTARIGRCMILSTLYTGYCYIFLQLCNLAVPYFCSHHGNFWAGGARLWTDHAVMALLLCMRILHAKTGTILVDMTCRRAMLQNLFPGSVAIESGSSWGRSIMKLYIWCSCNSETGLAVSWSWGLAGWACYCRGHRQRNNIIILL